MMSPILNATVETGLAPSSKRARLILGAIVLLFLIVRLPVLLRQPGGQDEDWFAVPGWTVLNEGIPRIPYLPSRNPETAFYRADTALYALPPAQFYFQAPIYAVFGPSWGTARIPSFLSGIVAILLVYQLGQCLLREEPSALWAAGLYSVSRVFYFPCLSARPDLLCGAIGLGAVYTTWRWQTTRNRRTLLIAGGLAGLGFLTHPFALVYSIQVGVWVLLATRGWKQRLLNILVLGLTAAAVMSVWSLLIWQHPEIFRIQFFNNVLDRSSPGLFHRLIFPFEAIWAQAQILVERAGLMQTLIMVLALPGLTIYAVVRHRPELRLLLTLAWSSVCLHLVLVGTHPTKGYYCYTGAFLFMCLGTCVTTVGARFRGDGLGSKLARVAGGVILVGAFVPGSGIRTCMTYLQNWDSLNHDSAQFSEMLITELPVDAKFTVDTAFVLDFYLAGRDTVLAKNEEFFFESDEQPYDYLVVGRFGIHAEIPKSQNGRLLKTFGDQDDIFSCYAEIYVPNDSASVEDDLQ